MKIKYTFFTVFWGDDVRSCIIPSISFRWSCCDARSSIDDWIDVNGYSTVLYLEGLVVVVGGYCRFKEYCGGYKTGLGIWSRK